MSTLGKGPQSSVRLALSKAILHDSPLEVWVGQCFKSTSLPTFFHILL
jgi:hypothetical protein